jgi:cytochrome b
MQAISSLMREIQLMRQMLNTMPPLPALDHTAASAPQVRVWDPLLRIFHWALAASFAVAFVAEDDFLSLHVRAGYLILGLVLFRMVWGFVGPRHARWSDFVRPPAEITAYLWDALRFRATRHLGHDPAGGAMVLALLLSLLATGLSGLALYGAQELSGPLAFTWQAVPAAGAHVLEDVHEVLANLTLLLVVLHLAGVALASLQHRENLVKSMVTGYKRRETS